MIGKSARSNGKRIDEREPGPGTGAGAPVPARRFHSVGRGVMAIPTHSSLRNPRDTPLPSAAWCAQAAKKVCDFQPGLRRRKQTTPSSRDTRRTHPEGKPGSPRRGRRIAQWNSDPKATSGSASSSRSSASPPCESAPYHDARMPHRLKRADYIVSSNVVRTLQVCRRCTMSAALVAPRSGLRATGPARHKSRVMSVVSGDPTSRS
jgi:hypothetical protein